MEAFDEKYGDIQANQRKKLKPKLSYSQVKCNRLYWKAWHLKIDQITIASKENEYFLLKIFIIKEGF